MNNRRDFIYNLAILVASFLVFGFVFLSQSVSCRASYLAGRFGLDRKTALSFAFQEGVECVNH